MELTSLRQRLLGLAWLLVPGDEAVVLDSSLGLLKEPLGRPRDLFTVEGTASGGIACVEGE